MRFFKANDAPRSAEDEAAYARLMAVADRSKVRDTIDFAPESSAESLDPLEAPDILQ
jgi:hypothetical protein